MEKEVIKGMNGLPIKIIEPVEMEATKYTDIYYDQQDRRVRKVETTVVNHTVVDEYIIWYGYHHNGELRFVSNNKGVSYHFDERGLPVKNKQ